MRLFIIPALFLVAIGAGYDWIKGYFVGIYETHGAMGVSITLLVVACILFTLIVGG